jgi:sensor domain CHASE-containing protein
LKFSVLKRRRAFATLLRRTNLPAVLALAVIVTAWALAERQQREVFQQAQRAEVLSHVSVLRAKLEGNINSNIQLTRGLVVTLATEPDMDQARFEALARNLLHKTTQVRNIAAARDFVVNLMYPLRGNESAVGLDYRKNDAQRGTALRARDTGEMILAGPLDLVQGGKGFIARFPVFTVGENSLEKFWGIVSAVIDMDRLYRDSGLLDDALPVEITLTGKNATGSRGTRFLGSDEVLTDSPVTADVLLPF